MSDDDRCRAFCNIDGDYFHNLPRNADGSCPVGDIERSSPRCNGNILIDTSENDMYDDVDHGDTNDHDGTSDGCGGGCPNTCDGTSLYAQKCVNGHCVKDPDALIETNSPTCKHIELPPIESKSNTYLLVGAIILFILIMRS